MKVLDETDEDGVRVFSMDEADMYITRIVYSQRIQKQDVLGELQVVFMEGRVKVGCRTKDESREVDSG